ncbi:MAG: guanylate kinase [Prevotellaceae bacterium]|jgi:guanylate kinase|nr:guanylate kinase [Prevotellaceae bacterium]
MNSIIVISAPSGSGKTTVINHLLNKFDRLEFSVSATSRLPRSGEKNGEHYYFLTPDEFKTRIDKGDFIEWEEVYSGCMYGTLTSEVDRIAAAGKVALFDVDVAGALNFKARYKNAFLIFVVPPTLEVLKERLERRASETQFIVNERLKKAKHELSHAKTFDYMLLNDDLDEALCEIEGVVGDFLNNKIVPDTFRIT